MAKGLPEFTKANLSRTIPRITRLRLMHGDIRSGDDIRRLRRFVGLAQPRFARAMGVSVRTLKDWERGLHLPEGPALVLLRVAAQHPHMLRENLSPAR